MYESRLSYFKDKARINYCKPLSVYQHGGPSRPRQNCHSCIFETKENSNLRICIQYLGHHSKTTCQKSAKSMRYRVRPKFEFYRKSLFRFFQMNTILAWKTRLVRGLRFKTKSFNSRAVDGRQSRVKYIKEERVKKNVFFVNIFLNTKTTLIDQPHNVFCP